MISGNLAKDCEVIQGKEGAEMLRFDVAVKDGRDKEETDPALGTLRKSPVTMRRE